MVYFDLNVMIKKHNILFILTLFTLI